MTEFQNMILEMIAKGEDLSHTILRLCNEVEKRAPGVLCSVLTIDPEGRLCSLAAPSLPASYSALIDGVSIGPGMGSCGEAAYFGKEVTSRDITTDPNWASFRQLIVPLGIRACWSSPIFDAKGSVIATFAFYYFERRGPSDIDCELVRQCVNLCAIALDRHRRVQEHERRANTDALTDLSNRHAFNNALGGLDCAVPGAWALCLVDLDNLKVVNDTFGHRAGDIMLRTVADRLAAACSPDSVFRVGGDEFAIIMHDPASLADLDTTMDRYLRALMPPADCGGNVVGPKATIGLAIVSHGDAVPERVRQNADFALYHAKETGRGGFMRYWPGIRTRMTRRLTAIREVDAALRENRIEAFYQPVVLFKTGGIIGMEALCRMRIGDQYVPASSFQDAITDAHIASSITQVMIGQVARDIRAWLDLGIPVQHVGINVSSVDFHNESIYATLCESFDRHNVPLKHVILEVTESVYMDDDAGIVRRSMAALRAQGLRIALDDFGTGYASLTHLMSVPVDIIKIDKSFVEALFAEGPSAVIVEGIIGIARKLGLGIVAEGVENMAQARRLMELDCAVGQGFFYSPALNKEDASQLMLRFAQSGEPPQMMPITNSNLG